MPALNKTFDRESLFQMLASKKWDVLAEILYTNRTRFRSDPVIQQAVGFFESEFLAYVEALPAAERPPKLTHIGFIIEENRAAFSPAFVERFIDVKLHALRDTNSPALLGFAATHQDRPLARRMIAELQQSQPEQAASARRPNMSIRATQTTQQERARIIRLFKSKQEESFYEAVRRAFPTYHPYPNVALSCVLDYSAIAQRLEPRERDFFFKGIVDCVVFDSSKGYEPLYFFELDSGFHDTEQAKANDALKDRIFEAANAKLIRIRAHTRDEATVENLQSLVLEVMRSL